MIDDTWNAESVSAVTKLPDIPIILIVIIAVAVRIIIKYHLTSSIKKAYISRLKSNM